MEEGARKTFPTETVVVPGDIRGLHRAVPELRSGSTRRFPIMRRCLALTTHSFSNEWVTHSTAAATVVGGVGFSVVCFYFQSLTAFVAGCLPYFFAVYLAVFVLLVFRHAPSWDCLRVTFRQQNMFCVEFSTRHRGIEPLALVAYTLGSGNGSDRLHRSTRLSRFLTLYIYMGRATG